MASYSELRPQLIRAVSENIFDILIVGGGINGASIARDAALRGYRVALVEQRDFGYGTSSRSSRLIHGGLRYLEHGEFGLVFESVSERARLASLARHIVRPLPFIFPIYGGIEQRLLMNIGLWIYDGLALFRNYHLHLSLSAKEIRHKASGIRLDRLGGGVLYYDYQTNDARLVIENILSARDHGAISISYARMVSFCEGSHDICECQIEDSLSGERFAVQSRAVVFAAGPWTDEVLRAAGDKTGWLRPTKGVHLVIRENRLPHDNAMVFRHPEDARILFLLPYFEHAVLGTTDTDFRGDPGDVTTTFEDVQYLL